MRKNATKILLAAVCLAICLSGCASNGPKVPVMSVAEIVGIGPIGVVERYAGVVKAGETVSVNKDNDMEISKISVSEGDAVTKGQTLFSYDTSSLSIDVERMQLEVEQMNNSITTKKAQITALEKEQKSADSAEKLQYTLQIQQLELDVKEAEYNVTAKKKEIERTKTKLADANVLSPVDGHIKAIHSGANSVDPMTGEPLPFITITQEGDFRVCGTVNEQNAMNIFEGMPMLIRSRTDDTQFWTGTISKVDWENPVQGNNNYYMYDSGDEMTSSSKYPFYIQLDGDLGLMLGQHVYIEPNNGQMDDGGEENFYLPSYYINDLDAEAWVWAANDKKKLEKRTVVLGNYNIDMDSYEILEGLTPDDFIAFPDESHKVGAQVRYPGEEDEEDGEFADDFDGELDESYYDGPGSFARDLPLPWFSGSEFDSQPELDDGNALLDPGIAVIEGTEAVG